MIYIIGVAILRMLSSSGLVVVIYSYRNQQCALFPDISGCYRARSIKDRQAIVAIFKVFWSLLSVKALKLFNQLQPDRRLWQQQDIKYTN